MPHDLWSIMWSIYSYHIINCITKLEAKSEILKKLKKVHQRSFARF